MVIAYRCIAVCKLVTFFIFSADCTYEYSETQMYVCISKYYLNIHLKSKVKVVIIVFNKLSTML
jgi:hypothetical protein